MNLALRKAKGGWGGWVKTRRGRGQLYMLVIDVAQLVINKNCIKKVLLLKIKRVRAPLAHPP